MDSVSAGRYIMYVNSYPFFVDIEKYVDTTNKNISIMDGPL